MHLLIDLNLSEKTTRSVNFVYWQAEGSYVLGLDMYFYTAKLVLITGFERETKNEYRNYH
jgi:hypothetical protein